MRGEAELFAHLSSKSRLPARSRGAEFSFYRARTCTVCPDDGGDKGAR